MVKIISKKDDEIPLLDRGDDKKSGRQRHSSRSRPEVLTKYEGETVTHHVKPDDTLEVDKALTQK